MRPFLEEKKMGGRRFAAGPCALMGDPLVWLLYNAVGTNTKRYEQRLQSDRTELSLIKGVATLFNCEM